MERERERVNVSRTVHITTEQVSYRVDSRVWVDLQCVHVISGVLEEAVVRIEHLVREEIDPLSSDAAIIQTILTAKPNVKLFLQISHSHLHDLTIRLFKDVCPGHFNATVTSCRLEGMKLRSQRLHFVNEISTCSRGWG